MSIFSSSLDFSIVMDYILCAADFSFIVKEIFQLLLLLIFSYEISLCPLAEWAYRRIF